MGITVTKQASANVTNTAACGRRSPASSSSSRGAELEVITDDPVFIRNSLTGVQRTLIEAVLLTGLVLLVFRDSWRSTVIVLLAIPTSLIATFGVMWLQGFTLNFLTTLALTLTIGILVDDSIVVLENIYRHLARASPAPGGDQRRAEIGLAAIAITLVDVVVFTPVALMSGQVGQFFRQFGFTVVSATLFSLLFLHPDPLAGLPLAEGGGRARAGAPGAFGRWWERGFDRLTRVYERAPALDAARALAGGPGGRGSAVG